MPSLIAFGASSTSAFASLRPRPVAARTTLMTWIFLSPAPVSTTSTVVDSSSAAAPSGPPAPAAGAAAATAAAETPNSSSRALMRSASSATEMPLSSSIQSCVLVAISCLLLRSKSVLPARGPALVGSESLQPPPARVHRREPKACPRRRRLRRQTPRARRRPRTRRRRRQAHRLPLQVHLLPLQAHRLPLQVHLLPLRAPD